jgi:hypothetical protein
MRQAETSTGCADAGIADAMAISIVAKTKIRLSARI